MSRSLLSCSAGCVVNTSGMLGRMAHAAGPPYCITRFGAEAFSDCLRYEVHPLGVKVGVVEPGNFIATTSLHVAERIQAIASKMWDELPAGVRKDYGRKYLDERVTKMETYCNGSSTDTSPIISAVTHTLTSGYPLHTLPPHGLLLLGANADHDPLARSDLRQDLHTLRSFALASVVEPWGEGRGRREGGGGACVITS